MKVILVGYGEMLRALASGILNSKHEIVGILRQETVNRIKIKRIFYDYLKPSSDYLFIKAHNLHEIEARSVNSYKFRKAVKDLNADIVIVGSWSEKFSVQTINTIQNGFVNVHPSLLPKYRGPNPYLQVILHNEQTSGITFHLMDVNYDTGSILHQKEIAVLPDDTGGSLRLRCCESAKHEVVFLLDNFTSRIQNMHSQDEQASTYQPQISLRDAIISFRAETSVQIERRVRALSPWIHCFLAINNEFFRFEKCEITNKESYKQEGTIVNKTDNAIFVACKDKKVIKFSNLTLCRPFSKYISKFFFDKFIKINDSAL